VALTWVDYFIVGLVSLSAIVGFVRGFIREAVSLVAWIGAFVVGWTFFEDLAPHLEFVSEPSLQLGAAFAILFFCTLIVGALINFLIGQMLAKGGLSGTDRLAGFVFGVARGAILIAFLVLLAGLTSFPENPMWQEAQLIEYFRDLAVWLRDLMPPDIAEKFDYV
jgi:membrane protein required for colicin V production